MKSQEYPIDLRNCFSDIEYRKTDERPRNIGSHHHPGFEVLLVYSGTGTVLIGENIYPLLPGTVYLINSSSAHCTNPGPKVRYSRSKITFLPSVLISLLERTDAMHLLTMFTGPEKSKMVELNLSQTEHLDGLFNNISGEYDRKKPDHLLKIVSMLLEMLISIHRRALLIRGNGTDFLVDQSVAAAVRYINENLEENLTIDDLCGRFNYSKFHFCRKFKATTGITIGQFIIQQRISRAKDLLKNTDRSVSDIALSLGFGGNTQFTRHFKRLYGRTPRSYRSSC